MTGRWVGGQAKLHMYLEFLPIACIDTWALRPLKSAVALDSHRSSNSTVNCACDGSRMHTPYEHHPETTPLPKSIENLSFSWNWSLVPKMLRTTALWELLVQASCKTLAFYSYPEWNASSWRNLCRGWPWSDFAFKRSPLAAVLRMDCKWLRMEEAMLV